MKKAEEYLEKYNCLPSEVAIYGDKVIELIKQAQLDAIEEAVKRCAESAETCFDSAWNAIINEDSILNVAEQLRKEIE